jgi:hypothetical protein
MITSSTRRRAGDAAHLRFRDRLGSDFIASGFALGQIQELIERRRPRTVLEVGAGIGALTAAIADAIERTGDPVTQVAIEDEPFCLEQLAVNLGSRYGSLCVYGHVADLPASLGLLDLVVIDGGATTDLRPEDRDRWTAADERGEMQAVLDRLALGAVVVFENRRDAQRAHLEALAPAGWVHEHVVPIDASPGYHVYWFAPSLGRRVAGGGRNRLRRLWFPAGIRRFRWLYWRVNGRSLPTRAAVAPGGGEEWASS